MDVVMDANVLGEVCRNNKKALKLLKKIKNHRVIYCTEIFNEYKVLPKRKPCKNPKLIEEWLIGLVTKAGNGKKIKITKNVNTSFRTLIKRGKFAEKDIIYINVVQKSNDKVLIAFERHFINAERCISQLGIKRLDLEEALTVT